LKIRRGVVTVGKGEAYILRCHPHIHAFHDDFFWDIMVVGSVAIGGGGGGRRVCNRGVGEFCKGRGG